MENNYTTSKFKQLSDYLRKIKILPKVVLLTIGFLSTIWILNPVIPKVLRVAFSCIKASGPFAASFITFLLGLGTFTFLLRKATEQLKLAKYRVAFVFIMLGLIAGTTAVIKNNSAIWAKLHQGPKTTKLSIGILGDDIEFVKALPPESQITPDNSGLLSEQVNAIFIDSFNIKWFATPLGISRYNDENWDTINTDNYLLNNNVKDMAYERTGYGHELWVATDGGLSVLAFDQIDGVTSATTYHIGNSQIINDTVAAVGVDVLHNRWMGTPAGLSVFYGSNWDSTKLYMDFDRNMQDLAGIDIVDIQSYPEDSMIYVNTHGGGTLRYTRNDVDGITAASSYEQVWGGMNSDTINKVVITGTLQWFGANNGAHRHIGNLTKSYWLEYNTDSGLISNNVIATEVDNHGIVWLGTDAGLSILTPAGFYTYTVDDGLINSVINDIKKDYEGNIWIATNGGVEMLSDVPGSFTKSIAPIQSSNIELVNIQTNEMTVSWTIGEGTNRVVFVREGNDGEVAPVNNTVYTANSSYPNGSAIGDWYCVYNGQGNTVTITDLDPETEYRVMVCDYGDFGEYITYSRKSNYNNVATYITLVENVNLLTNGQIIIYPTPFRDFLHITLDKVHEHTVANLFTINGKMIETIDLDSQVNIINTSDIKSGVYIMMIERGEKSYSYKLVK